MIRPSFTGLLTAAVLATTAGAAISAPSDSADASTALNPAVAVANSCPSAGGAKVADAADPSGAIKIYGHGWGHGMGMSQYGAQGAAKLGCGYRTILATYYRNTDLVSKSMSTSVTLSLASSSKRSTVLAENGPVTWLADRTAVQPKGSTWTVTPTVSNGVRGIAVTDAADAVQLFAPTGSLLRARTGGTVVRVKATGSGSGLRTSWGTTRFTGTGSGIKVSHVIGSSSKLTAVQKYLYGLGEVPAGWPVEALKAQVVAARTYLASKYSSDRNSYVLSTGTADQVYLGYDREAADARLGGKWKAAVNATAGQVLVDGSGRIISAMYSSSMGGHTENRQYVYGRYGISYLKAVDDSRWDNASDNPYRKWAVGFSRATFASKLGFTSVTTWKVAERGDDKRLDGITVTGVKGGRTVTVHFTGSEARGKLGLRSPGFVFGGTTSDGETGNG
ncbi:SpoIID/LytB domain-containing protein [Spongisporangium articulatum]|uniref:SpoIID/LytB domain-containing protein n=1 Tax=Spongisporangium articulatum TaxID=3362603 RepID=A0ABW8APW9_9ACTN